MSLAKLKYGLLTILGIFFALVLFKACRPDPVPVPVPQSTIELAAQHSAAAIVAVTKNTDVHQRHIAAKRKVDSVLARMDSLQELPAGFAEVPTPREAAKDTAITILTADNARLDSAITKATEVLAQDTTVRLHQESVPAIKGPSLSARIGKAVLSNLTIGYGVVYDGHTITTGPSASVGLHLTSGIVGVTAGATLTYANATVHVGVGATVGVRL